MSAKLSIGPKAADVREPLPLIDTIETNVFVKNSQVRMYGDRVEKYTTTPLDMARKYAAVQAIGGNRGFLAPRVLAVHDDRIVLERLRDLEPLQRLYVCGNLRELDAAVMRAGELLGQIHTDLRDESAGLWQPSPKFLRDLCRFSPTLTEMPALPHAVLHCDYSFANVFLCSSSPDTLAVIDPCPNYGSTFDLWTRGPIYLDIGKMLACLEGQVAARYQFRRPSLARTRELQNLFLAGYTRFQTGVNEEVAHAFAFATASSQFRRRFGSLGVIHTTSLYSRFRGNFPSVRKFSS